MPDHIYDMIDDNDELWFIYKSDPFFETASAMLVPDAALMDC